MLRRNMLVGVSVAILVCGTAWAAADVEQAAKDFAQGKTLLAKGDFEGATQAFKAAATADPENKEYSKQVSILGRVVTMRENMAKEEDADAWQQMGRALYAFYADNHVDGELLAVAEKLHAKLANGESAALLGNAQLVAGKNAEAAALLGKLPADQVTPHTTILHTIALARTGQVDAAKASAGHFELPKDMDANLCFDAARMYALAGLKDKALAALKTSFEITPPSQLPAAKVEAKDCKDLQTLAADDGFAEVLKTESKIKDACGKCPSKGKGCPGEKAKAEGKDKAGGCSEHGKEQKPEKP